MRRIIELVLAAMVLVATTSCGGGGADGTGGNPSPAQAHSISNVQGDGQTASPGAAVAIAPTVLVKDAADAPLAGVEVTFTVTSGGGAVTNTIVRTDSAGRASCGSWTLGPASGMNALSADVAGLASVEFLASAANNSADVQVSTRSPSRGQIVGETVTLDATVTSTYQIASVVASAGGVSAPMHFVSGAWTGSLSLAGRARGSVGVVVTATDVHAHVTDDVVLVQLDRTPQVVVTTPTDAALARPMIKLKASCSDDDESGCASIVATVGDTVVARGRGSIDVEVDLSAFEGRQITLVVQGTDTAGQSTPVSRRLSVESSPALLSVAEVAGTVWDATTGRVLFLDTSGATPMLKLLDIGANVTRTLETSSGLLGSSSFNSSPNGFLTPSGVVYMRLDPSASGGSPQGSLLQWRTDVAATPVLFALGEHLRANGDWIAYDSPGGLCRRDLRGEVSDCVGDYFIDYGRNHQVGPNGDVVWDDRTDDLVPIYDTFRWRGDTVLQLSNAHTGSMQNQGAISDGIHVVYQRAPRLGSPNSYEIIAHDGVAETILTPKQVFGSYAAAGGYLAYTVDDGAGVLQVWRRAPAGDSQLTFFGSSSAVVAMAPDGSVLLEHGGRRLLAVPGSPLKDVGSTLGLVVVRDGRFLVLYDHAVLAMAP
ncbi:MAG: hypothetical protein U1F50_21280 [Rubrivivax sp.]